MLNCIFFAIMLALCEKSFTHRTLLLEDVVNLTGIFVHETRGREMIEQSLVAPYINVSSDPDDEKKWIAYWQTNVHGYFVELTPNRGDWCGRLWNTKPVMVMDWELRVSFKVFGPNKDKEFGDGMAIWYTEQRGQPGDVFCSRDYFKGLGVFLDTYKNGKHSQKRPFISAMVSNNDGHFKHHADGGDQMLDGNETGCQADFRNKQLSHETLLLVRYVELQVYIDFAGDGFWRDCLRVTDVHIPIGLYFGMSAMTGKAVGWSSCICEGEGCRYPDTTVWKTRRQFRAI